MDYRKAVLRTLQVRPQYHNLTYAALNMGGESGEVVDVLKKHLHAPLGTKLDHDHLIEEMGDVLWTLELLCILTGIDIETVQKANIHKLNNRFGIHD